MRSIVGIASALLAVSLASGACGSSQTTDEQKGEARGAEAEDPGTGEPGELSDEERALIELDARQQEACSEMCARLSECAVADAEATQPEELEGEDYEELGRAVARECTAECRENELSGRQVEVLETCTAEEETCEAYLVCLEAAQPEPEGD